RGPLPAAALPGCAHERRGAPHVPASARQCRAVLRPFPASRTAPARCRQRLACSGRGGFRAAGRLAPVRWLLPAGLTGLLVWLSWQPPEAFLSWWTESFWPAWQPAVLTLQKAVVFPLAAVVLPLMVIAV